MTNLGRKKSPRTFIRNDIKISDNFRSPSNLELKEFWMREECEKYFGFVGFDPFLLSLRHIFHCRLKDATPFS